jgi:ATP-dependent protease HslVU (ClpYQ) peptidase subunit
MSVVAVDGQQIAADGLMCMGQERVRHDFRKFQCRHGVIYAATGGSACADALIAWHQSGANAKDAPPSHGDRSSWSLLVIDRGDQGEIRMRYYSSSAPYPDIVRPPFAIGSGADFAQGAMHAGRSAREAVDIACKLSVWCGGEVRSVDIAEALGLPG